jgi:hypothetical protein
MSETIDRHLAVDGIGRVDGSQHPQKQKNPLFKPLDSFSQLSVFFKFKRQYA